MASAIIMTVAFLWLTLALGPMFGIVVSFVGVTSVFLAYGLCLYISIGNAMLLLLPQILPTFKTAIKYTYLTQSHI